ncbi:hypothetical protein [Streptomyces sp. NBC_01221]|uniref:hypothetical protein n=1 Tax=Streptomyces sp. NBC_01221 TaxID=2903782 RepID=UPI002B1E8483|nr:hypothetical protein [Streptomyces sp. NBC_01221]
MTRLLTAPTQWEHARAVLAHVADHTPLPGPEARLLMLMPRTTSALVELHGQLADHGHTPAVADFLA